MFDVSWGSWAGRALSRIAQLLFHPSGSADLAIQPLRVAAFESIIDFFAQRLRKRFFRFRLDGGHRFVSLLLSQGLVQAQFLSFLDGTLPNLVSFDRGVFGQTILLGELRQI